MYQSATEELKEQKKNEKQSFKLAKVTTLFEDGCPKVQFYGESTTSSKKYKVIHNTEYAIGDIVIVASIENSYVILGTIDYIVKSVSSYLTKADADLLYADKDHTHNYSNTYAAKNHSHDYSGTYAAKSHSHSTLRYDSSAYVDMQSNALVPSGSGGINLGTSYNKFKNVYATTGTIQTSDKNQKHDIEDISQKYIDFLKLLHPIRYKLNDGTSDRYHIGFVAQEVEQAMIDCDIDSKEFGGFVKETCEDGTEMYALRYEEFIALNIMISQMILNENEELKQRLVTLELKMTEGEQNG